MSRKYPATAPASKLLLSVRAGLVLSRAKDHDAVFDFGAGDLKFVRALSAYGIPCTYFLTAEIKTDKKELKKNLKGKRVLMTAFDVFEHLPAPEKVVKEYAPETIIATLPIVPQNFTDPRDYAAWTHYRPDEHKHYFTEASAEIFFERAGYMLKEVSDMECALRRDILTFVGFKT